MKSTFITALLLPALLGADNAQPGVADVVKSYRSFPIQSPFPTQVFGPPIPCARPPTPEQAVELRNYYGSPHINEVLKYYYNDLADAAMGQSLPAGSVIVKEKLAKPITYPEKVRALAGMIKRPAGALPKSGDWEFFWYEDGKFITTGLETCAGCHSGGRRDYVFQEFGAPSRVMARWWEAEKSLLADNYRDYHSKWRRLILTGIGTPIHGKQ